ncbi:MAG: AgmX/PglI C-terminal domain-containing protein [Desulfosarcina sp.]
MKPSLLAEELAPLNAQIEETQAQLETLEAQMGAVQVELEKHATVRQRVEALTQVCDALDKLEEHKAGELFWKGIVALDVADGHLKKVRARISRFEERISGVLEKQATLQEEIDRRRDELDFLYDEVDQAHEREQRRKEEFIIEREISEIPFRKMIMPWTKEAESERRFRRAVVVALLVCFVLGSVVRWITVPVPDRSVEVVEIPERLAKLVKNEPPIPAPPPKPKPQPKEEAPKPEEITKSKPEKPKKDAKPEKIPKKAVASKKPGGDKKAARRRAERTGVLAFKQSFADLMDETPIAKLGTEARISKASPRVAGQAVAQRSLVAIQAKGGSSGGIRNARVSRNVGSGKGNGLGGTGIGKGGASGTGAGFAQVASAISDLEESDRPLSDGPGPGRTDEEIQIVFDRYKATLYRIYNKELRKDPTLRGKILLRIRIEENGSVSLCKVESTDLASPELVKRIVARIKRFNFGFKEGVLTLTILYPIDFLPAG